MATGSTKDRLLTQALNLQKMRRVTEALWARSADDAATANMIALLSELLGQCERHTTRIIDWIDDHPSSVH